jgi:hypothetical protein
MDEILENKKASINRCIKRIHEDFQRTFTQITPSRML